MKIIQKRTTTNSSRSTFIIAGQTNAWITSLLMSYCNIIMCNSWKTIMPTIVQVTKNDNLVNVLQNMLYVHVSCWSELHSQTGDFKHKADHIASHSDTPFIYSLFCARSLHKQTQSYWWLVSSIHSVFLSTFPFSIT